jgi:hypothetical protein
MNLNFVAVLLRAVRILCILWARYYISSFQIPVGIVLFYSILLFCYSYCYLFLNSRQWLYYQVSMMHFHKYISWLMVQLRMNITSAKLWKLRLSIEDLNLPAFLLLD